MNIDDIADGASPPETAQRPGDMLRKAREDQGLSIDAVAGSTRVPIRHLHAIENNDFTGMPGIAYAVGFSRTFARAVGLDETMIATLVRAEIGAHRPTGRPDAFEPIDPARVPPRWLAWTTLGLAVALALGYGVWRAQLNSPPTDEELNQTVAQTSTPAGQSRAPAAPVAPATSPVVLTATSDVWLRIYDAAGERLFEKQMVKGESYTVPAAANNPMILTGRPDALDVTVAGKAVPPLGPPERTIADVPISGSALLARAATPATTGTGTGTAPTPPPPPPLQPMAPPAGQ